MPSATGFLAGMATGIKLLRSAREIRAMVVALAVGVGLTVTVYGVIDAVLLTPLPYDRPQNLVQVWTVSSTNAGTRVLSEVDEAALAAAPSAFTALAHYSLIQESLDRGPGSAAVQLRGALVSTRMFEVLGVRGALGRTLESGDDLLSETPPIVVSERLVRSGTVSGAIGDLLRLDGTAYRLVGIMPDAFWFPDRQTSYWLPLPSIPSSAQDASAAGVVSSRSFSVIGRLAPGVTRESAESQANVRLSANAPRTNASRVRVDTYADLLTEHVRPALLVLQAASALVLLLVCLNVGWLYVARARRLLPAFATMRALGASPGQVLTTHAVSAVCVAAIAVPCAVLLAWLFLRFGMTLESGVFSRTAAPAITWRVIAVACLVTVLASIGACMPGAITVARWKGSLNEVAQTATRHRRLESLAMVVQVGLVFAAGAQAVLVALVLLSLSQTNVGLRKTDFVVVSLGARAGATLDPKTQLARYKLLLTRLERQGIRAASANIFPLTSSDYASTYEPRRFKEQLRTMIRTRVVTPSYFQVTGLVPTSGRLLSHADVGSNNIVVTEDFGPSVLRRRDVLGVRTGNRNEWTIVGVVPAVRQYAVNEQAKPEAYVLYDDFVSSQSIIASELRRAYILAETALGAAATLSVVRREVGEVLPDVDIQSTSHVKDLIDLTLGVNRLVAAGSVVFASVALLLAALGLHAMVSHRLAQRRREIGIRLALGATSGRIAVESLVPIGVIYGFGLCVGMALLVSARSAIQSVMAPPPGVGYPPLLIVASTAATILLAVVIVACYRPVRASTETDPALLLRVE